MSSNEKAFGPAPLAVMTGCLVLLVAAMVVIAVVLGPLAAAITFSLLAVLIGVAALTFSKLARRR